MVRYTLWAMALVATVTVIFVMNANTFASPGFQEVDFEINGALSVERSPLDPTNLDLVIGLEPLARMKTMSAEGSSSATLVPMPTIIGNEPFVRVKTQAAEGFINFIIKPPAINGVGQSPGVRIVTGGAENSRSFKMGLRPDLPPTGQATVQVSPKVGSLGDQVTVSLSNYPPGTQVDEILIAGLDVTPPGLPNTSASGAVSFGFVIPEMALDGTPIPLGEQQLSVTAGGASASTNLTITDSESILIASLTPEEPNVLSSRQWLAIHGHNFLPEHRVLLRLELNEFLIPVNRTVFVSTTQIKVFVGLTEEGAWSAQIVGAEGPLSDVFPFQVVPVISPPGIFEVAIADLTETSVIIRWRTSTVSDSKVVYGVSFDGLSSVELVGEPVTDHVVALVGLKANTKYLFEVQSTYNSGILEVDNNRGWLFSFITPIDVTKLGDEIALRLALQKQSTYPDYLLDVDSFQQAVSVIWTDWFDWLSQQNLNDKYAEFYWMGVDYDSLSFIALIRANSCFELEDYNCAQKNLQEAKALKTLSNLAFSASFEVLLNNLDASAILAEGIRDGSRAAVSVGLRVTNPAAAEIIDLVYLGVDYGIDSAAFGEQQATKNLLTGILTDLVFNVYEFDVLGGKTLSDAAESQLGKELFPVLQDLFKDEGLQFALSNVAKEVAAEVEEEVIEQLTSSAIEALLDGINYIDVVLNSPGNLRIVDAEQRVTGLLAKEVRNEIPMSIYQNETILLRAPVDDLRYEVVGTEEGDYGLQAKSVQGAVEIAFSAKDIPITAGAVHSYTIDWLALAEGGDGVSLNLDNDGDGEFEASMASDGELTFTEFVLGTQVCGDQNEDGNVDVFDAIIDLQIIVGLLEPTEEQQLLSDVVRDGQINVFDVILTLQHIVELTEITECGPPS